MRKQKTKKIITAPLTHEKELHTQGYTLVCGVDEVGRGCIAGPVVACAVIMPQGVTIPGVNDSKQLAPMERAELAEIIKSRAVTYGVGWVSAEDIDSMGIQPATFEAMRRAIQGMSVTPTALLIDGRGKAESLHLESDIRCSFIVRGDSASHSIAAASIVAKVERDNYMIQMHETHPLYGFNQHKGYGTDTHRAAILENGVCALHRKTFMKNWEGGA